KTPGGLSFQNPFRCCGRDGAYPPLRASTAPSPLARSYGAAAKSPGDANLWRRDLAAWAAGAGGSFGALSFTFPGHRPPAPLNNVSRSALGWIGLRVKVRAESGPGISFYFHPGGANPRGDSTKLASIPAGLRIAPQVLGRRRGMGRIAYLRRG